MLKKELAFLFLLTAACLTAQKVDRTKPPETPPIPTYKLPPVHETKLPNGLSVVLVEDQRFPLITVRLSFQAGSKFDPNELPGLSENVGALLTEGTKTRSSRQIAEELAGIGGTLNAVSSPDTLTIAGSALAEYSAKLLELLADVALNASFPEDEVQLRKQNRKQQLLVQRSQPAFLAQEKLASIVFGSHPYSHIAPTPEALDGLDAKSLAGFRDAYLTPNNAVLILIGKLPARAEIMKTIQAQLGAWKQKEAPTPPAAEIPEPKRQLVLVDRPGSVQADIHVGQLGVTRASPDYFPLVVGNTILGGGISSRMFNNIREKKGFAYDARSSLLPRKDSALFEAVTQVRNEVVEPAMEAVLAEVSGMLKEPVTASELSDTKNFLSGFFLIRLETQNGLANELNTVKTMGLPDDFLEKYTTRVRSVEPDQIQAVARKYMDPEKAAVVVVGDAEKIGKSLEKFGKAQVIKTR